MLLLYRPTRSSRIWKKYWTPINPLVAPSAGPPRWSISKALIVRGDVAVVLKILDEEYGGHAASPIHGRLCVGPRG